MRRFVLAASILLVIVSAPRAGASGQSYAVQTEAVDDYTFFNGTYLGNEINDAQGFMDAVCNTGQSNEFTCTYVGFDWTDGNVWDKDFVDSDLIASGDDNVSFDQSGFAISYFAGHGTSDDGVSNTRCTSTSFCQTHWQAGSVCRYAPGNVSNGQRFGFCAGPTDRLIITSSATNAFGNEVDYSRNLPLSGSVAWGESPYSNGWKAGAGANGGVNLVVLDISNGVEPGFFIQNMTNAFAGVHMIATIMPTSGDTATDANRGSHFANGWQYNVNGIVADAWTNTVNTLAEGSVCGSNGVTSGGYGGINGCGCNVVTTLGANQSEAYAHREENWSDIQNDSKDGRGNGYMVWTWVCNYDAVTYPWYLP